MVRRSSTTKYDPPKALRIALSVLSAVIKGTNPEDVEVKALRKAYPELAHIEAADELACAVIKSVSPMLESGTRSH